MNFKETKLFKNKWTTIATIIIAYSIFMFALPRVTGYLTIIGGLAYGLYLFSKNQKFKEKSKFAKVLTTICLSFVLIFGLGLTTLSPESLEQSRLASEKAQIQKQEKLTADQKASEEKSKKEAEEKAKQEELAKQEEAKKPEEEKLDVVTTETTEQSQNTTASGQLKVHFINVGQADSILVQQGASNMLIDAGNNGDSSAIKNYLDSQGVTTLDVVIGTHAHEDHIGSMDYIINSFKVGKIYFPRQTATTKTFQDFVTSVKGKGLQLTAPTVGESFKLGEATATVLAPNSSGYEDANDYSIVIKLSYGSTSFLLTGDAEAVSESQMVSKGLDLSATVLKVGHHGSKSSTGQNFLNKVNPKYAVISVGKGNSYGHPTQDVMDRLKTKGVQVYRTDENGTVVATSDGTNVSFNTSPGSYNGIVSNSSTSSSSTSSGGSSSSGSVSQPAPKPVPVPAPKPTPAPAPAPSNNIRTVYYVPSGKSYHYNKDCSTLSRSKTILQGKLQDVINLGKSDPCDKCVN